ncbi:SAM-dependent methyltransferase [Flavobacterium akiainvivens]|uniref:SAM-dependent methyltransferase n=1 Tax=Flavobacterium akiainvivens TaxID=1202724 RepID=A0A0M8MKW8_9FLAO|nr:tRNA (5-methylaminomethyl-2-thiouridine)(34)-methyltransferase MnmD [Flavobacterium akiainvivens]KOS07927.1 SAM-dependent methyltransferase [Flavobacterium akiainvivens]SFQ29001.1 tRNA U34 5-methylaminomethyl-2-thiouridine-forming methyltransferase MnmC [Flavobacterium akiainvivens]
MKREIIKTEDGSVTIFLPEMNETYHSKFGAVQEAYHVFIKNGLELTGGNPVSILEIGFGTGLNAFITFLESQKNNQQIYYTGVEAYPVSPKEVALMNYAAVLSPQHQEVFTQMHAANWGEDVKLAPNFVLNKQQLRFEDITFANKYDLIYFDAFGYPSQPDLWSEEIFAKMYTALRQNGVLVTYACRTVIKKAMQAAGFTTQKLPGPPGKREMLRAYKN